MRAEDQLKAQRVDILTARAVSPLLKAVNLFGSALKNGAEALFYKGPDVQAEINEALPEARKRRIAIGLAESYDLPDGMGKRTIVKLSSY